MCYEDLEKWKTEDILWEDLVECLVSHCTLPRLSLTIIASYFYSDDPFEDVPSRSEEGWRHHQAFYQSFVPGLRKLVDNGLVDLNLRSLHHLNPWTE